jgi:hypothetical protein
MIGHDIQVGFAVKDEHGSVIVVVEQRNHELRVVSLHPGGETTIHGTMYARDFTRYVNGGTACGFLALYQHDPASIELAKSVYQQRDT